MEKKATLAIINGKIWTGDNKQEWIEAFAVANDKIICTGTNQKIAEFIDKETVVIDARDNLVVPGFIDSHVHFIEGGLTLISLDLRNVKTPDEFKIRISNYVENLQPGQWILGGNWDHEKWGGLMPSKDWIDDLTPNNPVWLKRIDGHAGLTNSLGLKLANISSQTPDIDGGIILRKSDRTPTGILKDNAICLINSILPQLQENLLFDAIESAMNYTASFGITSVHNLSLSSEIELPMFELFRSKRKLRTRIYTTVPIEHWKYLKEKIENEGNGDEWLKWGAVKAFADGSLGSRTAAFFEPYLDDPENRGILVYPTEELYRLIKAADRNNLQVMVHAIGDRAIRNQIEILEQIIKTNGERDRRFRIEHLQHVDPMDIVRLNQCGIIASMQPAHLLTETWAEKVIDYERIKSAYAFRSLLDFDIKLAFGSDWFVSAPMPLEGIYAAVTRITSDNKFPNGWIPVQRIAVGEALKAYTIGAAYSVFEEDIKGSIEVNKLADFCVLDRNIFTIHPEEINKTEVLLTVVGGEIIYEKLI